MDKFIGEGTDVVTMLLLFITGLLTKRFVPWWVYEDVLKKLKDYEEAAPELITEVRRLMSVIEENKMDDNKIVGPAITANPKTKGVAERPRRRTRLPQGDA